MVDLMTFFIILASGLFLSEIFQRLHLPYVVALVIAGILVGPHVFNLMQVTETVTFLGSIGVVFLMFIAGSEIKSKTFKQFGKNIFIMVLFNSAIPFMVGFSIGQFFGYTNLTSLMLGTIFASSSIAVIIPSLEFNGVVNTKVGRTIISTTVLEDIGSLLVAGFILQSFKQKTFLPLYIYIPLILLFIVLLKLTIPTIQRWYHHKKKSKDLFENELRFIFTVLIASVLLFEVMGMHSIIAGFIIGIFLADSLRGRIHSKIRTISYGIFIPVFFLLLGVQTDLSVFSSLSSVLLSMVIVCGLIISKIVSGWFGGVLSGFSKKESLLIGISTIPQLSTTLAVAYTALEFKIINQEIITALITLSMITTILSPLLIKAYFAIFSNKK